MDTLFPIDLPGKEWVHFGARGFTAPACGVIYRLGHTVTNGLALGGIDTGCIDLETSGLWGYCTLFNTHVPRRGPLNLPFLGLSTGGKTWVLCHPEPKQGAGSYQHPPAGGTFRIWGEQGWENRAQPLAPGPAELNLEGVETASQIHYWGHYPVADLEFETSAPVQVGLRAWSPFLPGDLLGSIWPAIGFEVHLRNGSTQHQRGAIALSFPGPTPQEAGTTRFAREEVAGLFKGVVVRGDLASYALGVAGEEQVRLGGELGAEGPAWTTIAAALPTPAPDQPGASAAVDFALQPGQERVVRFVLSWCAPTWKGGGYNWAPKSNRFTHMYARHYPDPLATARRFASESQDLRRRVLAWQEVIYGESALPVWLRDSLVNVLYLLAEDSLWAQKSPELPAWVREEDGLFGLNECPRGCPQIECIPCSFYGNLPLAYFFPELALSTLRGYQGYQYPDGAPPWIFGGCTGNTAPIDLASPTRGYQFATNGISLVAMVDRLLRCGDTSGKAYLEEFYPLARQCTRWTMNLRTTPAYSPGERVIAMPDPDSDETLKPPTEWFEAREPGWFGVTAHVGGLRLAQLRLARRLAQEVGDLDFARQCDQWLEAGARAMEERLWTGAYYLNFLDPESGQHSDFIFGYQLDGEWIIAHHGLPPALPRERIGQVLETIERANIALTRYGAVNYANADGTPIRQAATGTWDYGTYSYFPPEALMLAMTYMYYGQREFGAELARRVWHNITCLQGYTWDLPNIMRGDVDTGERTFGNDYYQDLMLWSLPAALRGEDLAGPCRPDGLVARIRRAAAAT